MKWNGGIKANALLEISNISFDYDMNVVHLSIFIFYANNYILLLFSQSFVQSTNALKRFSFHAMPRQ